MAAVPDSVDVALKEFDSVRAEIAAHQRTIDPGWNRGG
jgi:hypothetical protein